ncbi:MAG TPA: RNA methyltransferase [Acidimicrobiia bacterium]|nr:RNA methyltransferase [Acidimicrobiia bacterium]
MEPLGRRNRRVVETARLHRARNRRQTGLTIIEGPNLLDEALGAGVIPRVVFALAGDDRSAQQAARHDVELALVDAAALERIAGTESPRGPAAVIEVPAPGKIGPRPSVVAWELSDPGNVGTLIRTAAAFGWDFGHTTGTADPWAPKVLRAGAGGHFRVSIGPVGSFAELADAGLTTVATVVSGGAAPDALGSGRFAVLVGEEAAGLPADVVAGAALRVTVPMPGGTESLNASIAAAIVVYELSRH